MKKQTTRLTFTPKALPLILKAFGAEINNNGIIIDSESKEPHVSPEGEVLTKENFGGLKKGSTLFLKKDLLTAIKISESKY
ncbi:MAG: hypothetical protein ABI675_15420 [Chitinophagaceae bacterium]